jgi:hypothetical protein
MSHLNNELSASATFPSGASPDWEALYKNLAAKCATMRAEMDEVRKERDLYRKVVSIHRRKTALG